MEASTNITTPRRDYPSSMMHKARDTYVLMATVSVILLAFAFVMAFLHRKCKNSLINAKNWINGKAPTETGSRKQTTSGKTSKMKLRLDHPSSPVYSKDVYAPTYYLCKEDKVLKMKQSYSKDRKGSLKTMHTIQEDAEDDSGISIISGSTPNPTFSYDPSILQHENYKNTPITVEHDGCLIRVLAPESITSHPDYYKHSLTNSDTDQGKMTNADEFISSRHSSIISFPQNEEFMRRNSSFSSDCGFTHVDLEDCQCCPKASYTDISIGTSKCLSEAGSHTSLSNISGEYYLHRKQSSFDSLTSNEILMAIGTCKRHSLKPKLESKNSFDSVSLDTAMDIYDFDSRVHSHVNGNFEADDHSLLCESCDLEQFIHSKINKKMLNRKSFGEDEPESGYENFAFECNEDKDFNFNQEYNDMKMADDRYGLGSNSFDVLEANIKTKLHRLSRSNTFPNRKREMFPCDAKFENLPDIVV